MKLLSIGNSFSDDAHARLRELALLNGEDIETYNLYIGGCPLQLHWENFVNDKEDYDLRINGANTDVKIGLSKALSLQKWDVITFQQASGYSGLLDSYEPYLSNLAREVRSRCADARFFFHQTWAYEKDSSHEHFPFYNSDQKTMFEAIKNASQSASESLLCDIIPSGEIIQLLRDTLPEFDYGKTGTSLCRDGFHLSLDFGRFAAAATWLAVIFGKMVENVLPDIDARLQNKILDVINEYLFA